MPLRWFINKSKTLPWYQQGFFRALTPRETSWLGPRLREQVFGPSQWVVRQGDGADGFYFVLDGQLEVVRRGPSRDHIIAEARPGEIVGELAVVDGRPRSASVRARSKSHLLFVPMADIKAAASAEADADLAEAVYQKLALGVSAQLASRLRAQTDESARSDHERLVLADFAVNVLILVSLYVLFENSLPMFRDYLPASTTAVSLPIVGLFGAGAIRFMQKSGYPPSFFGLGWRNLATSLLESLVFTVPFLALVTGLKWLQVAFDGSAHRVVSHPDIVNRLTEPDLRTWLGIYVFSSVVQELIVRSALQSTLSAFLPGRSGTVRSIAVCALLFSVSHLHISLTFALAALVPGVFWGWLFHRRRHLIGPAISHVVVGGYVFFVLGS